MAQDDYMKMTDEEIRKMEEAGFTVTASGEVVGEDVPSAYGPLEAGQYLRLVRTGLPWEGADLDRKLFFDAELDRIAEEYAALGLADDAAGAKDAIVSDPGAAMEAIYGKFPELEGPAKGLSLDARRAMMLDDKIDAFFGNNERDWHDRGTRYIVQTDVDSGMFSSADEYAVVNRCFRTQAAAEDYYGSISADATARKFAIESSGDYVCCTSSLTAETRFPVDADGWWDSFTEQLAVERTELEGPELMALRLSEDVTYLNLATGQVIDPDITVEPWTLHGVRTCTIGPEEAAAARAGGFDTAAEWASEADTAWKGIDGEDELLQFAQQAMAQGEWKVDTPEQFSRMLGLVEVRAAERPGKKTVGVPSRAQEAKHVVARPATKR